MARIEANQRDLPKSLLWITAALLAGRVAMYVFSDEARMTVGSAKPPAAAPASIQWVSAIDAPARAATTNRPILYDFTADWCAPCHLLDEQVYGDPVLARMINDGFVPVRVLDRRQEDGANPPEVTELQNRYSVESFPSVVIADAQGVELRTMKGFSGRKAFEEFLNATRTSH